VTVSGEVTVATGGQRPAREGVAKPGQRVGPDAVGDGVAQDVGGLADPRIVELAGRVTR